jgi:hypothetical protein
MQMTLDEIVHATTWLGEIAAESNPLKAWRQLKVWLATYASRADEALVAAFAQAVR